MPICPDCHAELPGGGPNDCAACGWKLELKDGVPVLFSSAERSSPTFRRYLENYDEIAAEDLRESIQPMGYLQAQAEEVFSYLPPLAGLRVCEVGVGRGMLFDKVLAAKPSSLTGVDVSIAYLRPYLSREGPTKLTVALTTAESLPFANEFDLVIASEILEHVLNVGDFLISLRRSLAPGGQVVIRVPYKEDLRQYARQNDCPYEFVHLRNFTRGSLLSMMKTAGFKPRKLHYDGRYAGRRRRGTLLLHPLFRPYFARAYDEEGLPRGRLNRRAAHLLLQPVTVTGVFEVG